jgi:hypothetical protein
MNKTLNKTFEPQRQRPPGPSARATRPGRRRILLVAVALTAVAIAMPGAARASGDAAPTGSRASGATALTGTPERPFGREFNRPIASGSPLDVNSDAIVKYLAADGAAYANLYDYGTPIYYTTDEVRPVRVWCTKQWGACDLEQQRLPIPRRAEPNTGSDAAMVVVNTDSGNVYEFWQAGSHSDGTRSTSWGEIVSVRSRGGHGSTGSGISRLAGVIRTSEIAAGRIRHALVIATDNACQDVFRAPATKTDGASSRPDCIPEGARIQLNPDISLEALGLSPAEHAVAVALQRYGAYVIDNAGARLAMMFERPTDGFDPYAEAGLSWDYYAMSGIPWDQLRVLRSWDGS